MRVARWGRVSGGMMAVGVLLLAVVAMSWIGRPAHALTNCTADGSLDSEEQAFLGLLNGYRQANGLGSLTVSTTLNRDAAWMVNDLAVNHYFDHTDSLGRSAYARAVDCGYSSGAGENLAAGTDWSTAQAAFDAWKSSPGHNANMLMSYYRVVGIARVYNAASQYGWYWATEFGATDEVIAPPANTPTPTSAPTRTPTPTVAAPTPTPSPAATTPPAASPTATPSPAATSTPTPTPAAGSTTVTPTATPTAPTATATPTAASAGSATPAPSPTSTPTAIPARPANSLPLSPGANLVAWPSADVAPSLALGGMADAISIVYQYDPVAGAWLRYGPSLPSFLNNMTLLHRGSAYWVIAKGATQVPIR